MSVKFSFALNAFINNSMLKAVIFWQKSTYAINTEVPINTDALIFGWNCINGLKVTKIIKRFKFEGAGSTYR